MSLMEQLTAALAREAAGPAAQKTGLQQDMVAKVMPLAVAALLGGLKKNTAQEGGAAALASALDSHDGSVLNNLGGVGGDDVMSDGARILGHVLGGRQSATENALAKTTGVDPDQIRQLLAMAAPAVLGALGKQKREAGLDLSDLSALIGQERQNISAQAPRELGGLMQLLDADGDGDIQDDLLEQAGNTLLSGLFGKR